MRTNVPAYGLYGEANDASPDFWIHVESVQERSGRHHGEIKPHRLDHFFQMLQVRSGSGEAVIGSDMHRLEPGSLVLVPEKVMHGYRFSRDIDGQIITIMSDRLPLHGPEYAALRRMTARPRVLHLSSDRPDSSYIISTLDRVGHELSAGFGARAGLIESYVAILLSLIAGLYSAAAEDDPAASRDISRIVRLNGLIGAHFRKHLPVEFYARELGVSVTHLNRITKAQTGRTMNELLSDKIILQAKRALVFTVSTAQEIAYGLGFADPAYFTRFFSRETGETPRQFRERERSRHIQPKAAAE
jgi:AraC family transcriptional activator of pobA